MIKSSEYYLSEAAAAAELARQQTHRPDAMRAHVERGQLLLALSTALAEREAAGLIVPAEADRESVAFLDAHDSLWERQELTGMYLCRRTGAVARYEEAQSMFGPLRPAEVSR